MGESHARNGFARKVFRIGRPRRAAPTFTPGVHQYPRRKCRGGPPWPPDCRFLCKLARNILACLPLLVCFGFNTLHVFAQDLEILSKRPPVVRTFDPTKNESTIHGFLFNPDSLQNLFDPHRLQPNMRLHSVSYTYPGTTKARPQSVTFVIQPLNKQKTAPHFSFTADSTVALEGEATLAELCCVEIYGRSETNQHIVVTVPTEIFERMTQAKKIELKLSSKNDNHSFKLNDDQRKCLVALANTMK